MKTRIIKQIITGVNKIIFNSKANKPTPLGRWNINDNADIKSIQANYDSCCCSYNKHKTIYTNTPFSRKDSNIE